MAGASTGSFAAGFGKGLVNILLQDRSERQRRSERESDNQLRADLATLPTLINLAESTNDWTQVEALIGRVNPDVAKQMKKMGGSPFQALAPFLGQPGKAQLSAAQSADTTAITDATGGIPTLPSRPAVGPNTSQTIQPPPAPGSTLFGMAMPTPEQKMERQVSARRSLAGRQGLDPQSSIHYALTGEIPTGRTGTPPQIGTAGNYIVGVNAIRQRQGLPPLSPDEEREAVMTWERMQTRAGAQYGVDREAIALAAYGKTYGELDSNQQAVVIEQEQKQLTAESQARGTGTAQARFEAPVDIPTAQQTGVDVGTSAKDVAGQVVPTLDITDRRRSMGILQQDLLRIRDLIAVLPTDETLAGVFPGAVSRARSKMTTASPILYPQGHEKAGQPMTYRDAYAQLQSVVDSVVNVLARTRGEQRGTQTERDAERAYNAIVQIKTGITDPFGGDTRESAAVRLQEALDGLQRVMAALPATPVPGARPAQGTTQGGPASQPGGASGAATASAASGAPAAATPAAGQPTGAPTGFTMDAQGNILKDGQIVIPAQ